MTSVSARRSHQLLILAVAAGLVFVSTYVIFIRTPFGQRWDDRAYLGGLLASLGMRQDLTAILHRITVPSITLAMLGLLAVALVRRRTALGVLTMVSVGAAILTSEILKRALARPDLAEDLNALVGKGNEATFPSGHSTIATAFALGFVMVSAPRLRGIVSLAALVLATSVPLATVAAGWHRPSDAIGGIAVALIWLSAAAAGAARRSRTLMPSAPSLRTLAVMVVGVLILRLAGTVTWVWFGSIADVPVNNGTEAFLVGQGLVTSVAVAGVSCFAALIGTLDLGARRVTSTSSS